MPGIRILSEYDVRAAIDSARALELARATLRDQAGGASELSTPSSMALDATRFGGGRFKFKAATVGHLGASGIRLISRKSPTDPDAFNYTAVYKHDGLALSGLVPELWISRIRTAAFGTATLEALVNPGPLEVALCGTGKIAHELVSMLASALNVRGLRVYSRRKESVAGFIAAHAGRVPFPILAQPSAARAADGADVIITVTAAREPFIAAATVKRGAVVCSMGGGNELEFGVFEACDRLIVDDPDFASEVGDGGAWIKQNHLTRETFAHQIDALTSDVVAGTRQGRTNANDRVLAIVQGIATGDVAFSAYALREAEKHGRGKFVELP
jgi:ornithine cyclodeaminase/alanine dehydrogenase-like protein (mu-crystallin family)